MKKILLLAGFLLFFLGSPVSAKILAPLPNSALLQPIPAGIEPDISHNFNSQGNNFQTQNSAPKSNDLSAPAPFLAPAAKKSVSFFAYFLVPIIFIAIVLFMLVVWVVIKNRRESD